MSDGPFYKVKLDGGRILGPIDLDRIRQLIGNGQITGKETARRYPEGDWVDVNSIEEIAEILVKKAAGESLGGNAGQVDVEAKTTIISVQDPAIPTATAVAQEDRTMVLPSGASTTPQPPGPPEPTGVPESFSDESEKTRVVSHEEPASGASPADQDDGKTQIHIPADKGDSGPNIAHEKTVFLDRSKLGQETSTTITQPQGLSGKIEVSRKNLIRGIMAVIAMGLAIQEVFFPEEDTNSKVRSVGWIKPQLPISASTGTDPQKSIALFQKAIPFYQLDTVGGYQGAAALLLESISYDMQNAKAIALLASSYINLFDSSVRDENALVVISKLLERARALAPSYLETVVADVEFFVASNRFEAAQSRIVEYTKNKETPEPILFFYLGYVLASRGDFAAASRQLSQIPDARAQTPRILYLRGLTAERLGEIDVALVHFQKVLKISVNHARSRLRIAELLAKKGQLKDASPFLDSLVNETGTLPPRERAIAFYLHAQLNSLFQKWNYALADAEKAVRLDPENHDYLLEMYSLRAKLGGASPEFQKEAKMYVYLSEGEKLIKEKKIQEALTEFLKARQANLSSAIPLIRIGDMFYARKDMVNAKLNYTQALERQPANFDVAAKVIQTLTASYEWEEAQKTLTRYRSSQMNPSQLDRLEGDLYFAQGKIAEAAAAYKKALSRESIDSHTYVAFADSLAMLRQFHAAPFYYSLALRFDPQNTQALIGLSKCLASSESIDRGVEILQEELQKEGVAKADILSALAEFHVQKGDLQIAQQYVEQAKGISPDASEPYRIQALIHLAKEPEKTAIPKALLAYKLYQDRSLSDPSSYIERYKLFVKRGDLKLAEEELNRLVAIYPRYPNAHLYKGQIAMNYGNLKLAVTEFDLELETYPNSAATLLAMGRAKIGLNLAGEGLRFINQAMALQPRDPEAKIAAGWGNYLIKNFAGAAALFEAAATLDPGNSDIFKRMGMAYREMGNREQARKAFRKYLELEPDAPDRAEFQRY
ncbi:MAG: tetratricopeptide repeat protein [Bdellovibrionales bacterium]|nr:tetratricopeptide repeat protein [Bdellovibrionales bacterium]